jgi:hypothetical protein
MVWPGKRLGRNVSAADNRNLKMAKYITNLAPPPNEVDYASKINPNGWNMFLNDQLGICVPAAMAHMVMQWTTYAGAPFIPTDNQVLTAYEAIGGYVPGDPSTDSGCDMLTALKFWRKTGIAGHQIYAFVQVNATVEEEIKQAIAIFGNCFIGVNLPISAQWPSTGKNGQPFWFTPGSETGDDAPNSWGGHCVMLPSYGSVSRFHKGPTCVTWGQQYDISWGWMYDYCTEAFAVLSLDWVEQNAKSPSGFDIAQLQADLALL